MRQQQQNQKKCLVQDILIALRQQTEPAPVVQNQVIQVGVQILAVVGVAIADTLNITIIVILHLMINIYMRLRLELVMVPHMNNIKSMGIMPSQLIFILRQKKYY